MKKRFKIFNKGFTLIELLAVIVVLAVILAVAVPRVLNVIEESEKEAFRLTGENLVKAARDKAVVDSLNPPVDKTYTIVDGAFVGESLPITGKLPDSGTIKVKEDGTTSMAISNDKYCVTKGIEEEKVYVSNDLENCQLNIPEVVSETCFNYYIMDDEAVLTKYDDSCPKNVIIPNSLGGKPLTVIGTYAFSYYEEELPGPPVEINKIFDNFPILLAYNGANSSFNTNNLLLALYDPPLTGITSVTIPNTVREIQEGAFSYNLLVDVIIPDSVTTIGQGAFLWNQLTSVTIPNSVTTIGWGAFYNNQLTSVTIPNSVTTIGDYAFVNNELTSVTIPTSVTSIEVGVFSNNKLTSVTIPNSVTTIGNKAFYNNQLTSVTIPNSVTTIGNKAFADNQLTSVTIPNSVTIIEDDAFLNNKLTSVTIPNSVTSIGIYAFYDNQLTSVTIPNSVTTIGWGAFSDNQLTSVTIPNSVTTIGGGAFYNNQLTSVTIPNSVINIDAYAFSYNQLTSVTIPNNVNLGSTSISSTFYTSYVTNNAKAGGTYTAPSQTGTWTKQP